MIDVLFLELQKAGFHLWLGVLQRSCGQWRVGQVGHGGGHLRDAASQLLPGQQRRGRRAVPARGAEVGHIHRGVVRHRNRGSRLQWVSISGLLTVAEWSLRLHFQSGSEVKAGEQNGSSFFMLLNKSSISNVDGRGVFFLIMTWCDTHLACFMAPSTVLKSAPQSSTRQWKCTFRRKSQ